MSRSSTTTAPRSSTFGAASPHPRRTAATTLSPATASARFAHACSWQERCTQAVRDGAVAVPWGEARSRHRGPLTGPRRGSGRGDRFPNPTGHASQAVPGASPMNASLRAARTPRSLVARLAVLATVAAGLTGLSSVTAPSAHAAVSVEHRQPGRRGRRHAQGRAVRLRRRRPHPLRLLRPDQVGLRPGRQDAAPHRRSSSTSPRRTSPRAVSPRRRPGLLQDQPLRHHLPRRHLRRRRPDLARPQAG